MTERMPFDQEEMAKIFQKAEKQQQFWDGHYQDFVKQKKYLNKFVAVNNQDGQVVAYSKDLLKVLDKIKGKGLSLNEVWVRFITDNPQKLML
ncbi:hypothetical protein HYW46_05335 [Candidatus Daviesbacteria bacterium]|nr:hypothetical protein [Candidatus Daviesbacteria bacterium]